MSLGLPSVYQEKVAARKQQYQQDQEALMAQRFGPPETRYEKMKRESLGAKQARKPERDREIARLADLDQERRDTEAGFKRPENRDLGNWLNEYNKLREEGALSERNIGTRKGLSREVADQWKQGYRTYLKNKAADYYYLEPDDAARQARNVMDTFLSRESRNAELGNRISSQGATNQLERLLSRVNPNADVSGIDFGTRNSFDLVKQFLGNRQQQSIQAPPSSLFNRPTQPAAPQQGISQSAFAPAAPKRAALSFAPRQPGQGQYAMTKFGLRYQ